MKTTRKEKINFIIWEESSPFDEKDRNRLEEMDDDQLNMEYEQASVDFVRDKHGY